MESLVYAGTSCYHYCASCCHAFANQQHPSCDSMSMCNSRDDGYYHFRHTSFVGDRDQFVDDVSCMFCLLLQGMAFS